MMSRGGKESCPSVKFRSFGKADDHTLCPPVCRCPTGSQCDCTHCVIEILLMEAKSQAMSH